VIRPRRRRQLRRSSRATPRLERGCAPRFITYPLVSCQNEAHLTGIFWFSAVVLIPFRKSWRELRRDCNPGLKRCWTKTRDARTSQEPVPSSGGGFLRPRGRSLPRPKAILSCSTAFRGLACRSLKDPSRSAGTDIRSQVEDQGGAYQTEAEERGDECEQHSGRKARKDTDRSAPG